MMFLWTPAQVHELRTGNVADEYPAFDSVKGFLNLNKSKKNNY